MDVHIHIVYGAAPYFMCALMLVIVYHFVSALIECCNAESNCRTQRYDAWNRVSVSIIEIDSAL
jgi:hypothetical protein